MSTLSPEQTAEWEEALSQNEPPPIVEERYAFPEVIDNTARSLWTRCPQALLRSTINQLRLRGATGIHLLAGGSFARGLEVARRSFYEMGASVTEAEEAGLAALRLAYGNPPDTETRSGDKSLDGVERAYESYLLEYPLGQDKLRPFISADGKAALEFTGAIPIDIKHPVTGNPILYVIRLDMLGIYNDAKFGLDEKTTTSLGEQWTKQWELDGQFLGYSWGMRACGQPLAGFFVRGIGMLKTKTTHAEIILHHSNWMLDRWYEQLLYDVEGMVTSWKRQRFNFALDKNACNSYGGCQFKLLCTSPEPTKWIQSAYENHVWDPLAKSV